MRKTFKVAPGISSNSM